MRIVWLVLLIVTRAAAAQAEDWPQWRGPLGNGVSSEQGLPVTWSTNQNIRWRVKLPGAGVSSPIVAGERVFVTSQRGRTQRPAGQHPSLVQGAEAATAGERTLLGLSAGATTGPVTFILSAHRATDGQRLWDFELPAQGDLQPVHDKHNLATPSPVTDGRLVYALFGNGQLAAVDMEGKAVWRRHLGTEYSPFVINWGYSSSPALFEDLLILLCYHEGASFLLALDKQNGNVRWKVDRAGNAHSYSTPSIVSGASGPELIVNSSEGLEAHDPKTGALLWRAPEANRFPIPVPTHHDGTIYTTRGYRSSPYLAVRLGGRGDVSKSHVRWKVETGGPYVSSLVYYDGLLYMANEGGIVTCIDAATGERVWRERFGGIFTASPVAGDGKIYLPSETGETVVLRAGRTPEILARNRIDDFLVASPAIAGGRIYFRAMDQLIAIGQ